MCRPKRMVCHWIQLCSTSLPSIKKQRIQFISEEYNEITNIGQSEYRSDHSNFWWTRLKADIDSGQGREKLLTVGVEASNMGGGGGKLYQLHLEAFSEYTHPFISPPTPRFWYEPPKPKPGPANKNYYFNGLLLLLIIVLGITLMWGECKQDWKSFLSKVIYSNKILTVLHYFFFSLTPISSSSEESEGSLISSCKDSISFPLSQCFLISSDIVLEKTLQNINLKNFSTVRSPCVPPCTHQAQKNTFIIFSGCYRCTSYTCKWGMYFFKNVYYFKAIKFVRN